MPPKIIPKQKLDELNERLAVNNHKHPRGKCSSSKRKTWLEKQEEILSRRRTA